MSQYEQLQVQTSISDEIPEEHHYPQPYQSAKKKPQPTNLHSWERSQKKKSDVKILNEKIK